MSSAVIAALFVIAAAIGAAIRVSVALQTPSRHRPLATLAVNLAGSALAGLLVDVSDTTNTVVIIGAIGALTTFSTFVAETVGLQEAGRVRLAVLYAIGTISACTAAAWLGMQLT